MLHVPLTWFIFLCLKEKESMKVPKNKLPHCWIWSFYEIHRLPCYYKKQNNLHKDKYIGFSLSDSVIQLTMSVSAIYRNIPPAMAKIALGAKLLPSRTPNTRPM